MKKKTLATMALAGTLAVGGAVASPYATTASATNTSHGLRYCAAHNIQVHDGSRGDCVRAVQRFLTMKLHEQWGPQCELFWFRGRSYYAGQANPGPIDGIAGRRTVGAIKCFQADARHAIPGLAVDGWVGPMTYRAMLKWCATSKYYSTSDGKFHREATNWACAH